MSTKVTYCSWACRQMFKKNALNIRAPVTHARRTARALKIEPFWPVRCRSLGVRQHALLVSRARWTNATHSSSCATFVAIFVHAQKCAELDARMFTPEGRQTCAERPDQLQTNAEHTLGIRCVFVRRGLANT